MATRVIYDEDEDDPERRVARDGEVLRVPIRFADAAKREVIEGLHRRYPGIGDDLASDPDDDATDDATDEDADDATEDGDGDPDDAGEDGLTDAEAAEERRAQAYYAHRAALDTANGARRKGVPAAKQSPERPVQHDATTGISDDDADRITDWLRRSRRGSLADTEALRRRADEAWYAARDKLGKRNRRFANVSDPSWQKPQPRRAGKGTGYDAAPQSFDKLQDAAARAYDARNERLENAWRKGKTAVVGAATGDHAATWVSDGRAPPAIGSFAKGPGWSPYGRG